MLRRRLSGDLRKVPAHHSHPNAWPLPASNRSQNGSVLVLSRHCANNELGQSQEHSRVAPRSESLPLCVRSRGIDDRFVETEIEESLKSRTEQLALFRDLGPPDLVHYRRVSGSKEVIFPG